VLDAAASEKPPVPPKRKRVEVSANAPTLELNRAKTILDTYLHPWLLVLAFPQAFPFGVGGFIGAGKQSSCSLRVMPAFVPLSVSIACMLHACTSACSGLAIPCAVVCRHLFVSIACARVPWS
jgi:hypothetical protein